MIVVRFQPANHSQLVDLLKECDLPYNDIEPDAKHFFICKKDDEVIGCIGLELYGEDALLRSLAVKEQFRNEGHAKRLVETLHAYAASLGVKHLYLFTTTANKYFQKQGYSSISRENLPEAIKSSAEFSYLCPSSAMTMQKKIMTCIYNQ